MTNYFIKLCVIRNFALSDNGVGETKNYTIMRIKDANGNEHSVTSQAQGALNSVLGGLGTASFFGVNAGNVLGGLGRNCGCNGYNTADAPISRYEAGMMQELAAKDGKIALLESNIYTDQKIADVYERLNSKIDRNRDEQQAINREQAVYNGVNTATIQCMQGQIQTLLGITKVVVPNSAICPGWGNVTITPATATTTTAGQ